MAKRVAKRKPSARPRAARTSRGRPSGNKSIVLFSDGTGNSSAKLFKTNVWRMYEAVDLGPTAIDPEQIVYYDEGVGNSGFRPLAVLGGVFGWGLKRNVIELYSFLCRNYQESDDIYAFGFSRGAFTIRVLIGLIASQGIVKYVDEADLAHQTADAYRAAIRDHVPRFPPMLLLLPLWRMIVGLLLAGKRRALGQRRYDRAQNHSSRIRFVGLWDTVAAYGGPIIELVRAFDDWIRPLTFKDQSLPKEVDFARQALALDDERDAFQPVPWDEPMPTDRNRIKQVWFAGAHADVGGGYPDDSLSYVSLAWMMEEVTTAGLRLRPDKVTETNRIANAFGPIHNPRAGMGSYYRYQPRSVGAYVHPPAPGTESMEDPAFADQGLEHRAWVHQSVLYRIEAGTDGYAPITLPRDFRVVNHRPQDVSFPASLCTNLDATAAERADRQETLRDHVWRKRVLYFATVAASLGLASMPLWISDASAPLCGDARCVAGTAIGWLRFLVPGFAEFWIDAFAAGPIWTAIFVGLILIFRILGSIDERRLRDGTRRIWREALDGAVTSPPRATWIRSMRTSPAYQGGLSFIKWQALPFLLGLLMLLALLWAAAIAATQIRLGLGEGRGLFCGPGQLAPLNFSTASPCNQMGVGVVKNQVYEVRFYVRDKWQDGSNARYGTSPRGLAAGDMNIPVWGWLKVPTGYLFAPFRRVVTAGYLQPLVGIETHKLYASVHVDQLELTVADDGAFVGQFTAARSGSLTMFANDAVPPWPFDAALFYRGDPASANRGTACVAISRRDGDNLIPLITCDPGCATGAGACVARAAAKGSGGRPESGQAAQAPASTPPAAAAPARR